MAKRAAPSKEPTPTGGTAVARAHELFKQGRSSEALALLRPLLQRRDGVDGEAAALAAACLGADGKYEEAARIDRMMCESQPGNAQGWLSLGYDLFQAGDLSGALEAYAQAIEIEPNRASAHYNLARILMRMGEKAKAIEHFIRAVELQADFVDRLDEDPDLLPLKDDPELQDRLPGRAAGQDPYADYYATES